MASLLGEEEKVVAALYKELQGMEGNMQCADCSSEVTCTHQSEHTLLVRSPGEYSDPCTAGSEVTRWQYAVMLLLGDHVNHVGGSGREQREGKREE